MIAVAPVLIQTSMERVIAALMEVSKTKLQYSSGILLFSLTYPLYRGLIFIGGVALILFAYPIYKGEEWTYPASLLAARRISGWWLGLISGASILAIDAPTQIIRSTMSESTSLDYIYGSLLSAGLLFSLLFPKFKAALVPNQETQEQLPEVISDSIPTPILEQSQV